MTNANIGDEINIILIKYPTSRWWEHVALRIIIQNPHTWMDLIARDSSWPAFRQSSFTIILFFDVCICCARYSSYDNFLFHHCHCHHVCRNHILHSIRPQNASWVFRVEHDFFLIFARVWRGSTCSTINNHLAANNNIFLSSKDSVCVDMKWNWSLALKTGWAIECNSLLHRYCWRCEVLRVWTYDTWMFWLAMLTHDTCNIAWLLHQALDTKYE